MTARLYRVQVETLGKARAGFNDGAQADYGPQAAAQLKRAYESAAMVDVKLCGTPGRWEVETLLQPSAEWRRLEILEN